MARVDIGPSGLEISGLLALGVGMPADRDGTDT